MKILITSGGTSIPIDPVRSITNNSRGTSGAALVDALVLRHHDVTLLRAVGSKEPGSIPEFEYKELQFTTYAEYAESFDHLLKTEAFDAVVCAAAVSDYGVVGGPLHTKVRFDDQLTIQLIPVSKVIQTVKGIQPDTFLVGYKMCVGASVEELICRTKVMMDLSGADLGVANNRKIPEGLLITASGGICRHETFAQRTAQIVEYIEASNGR